VSAVRMEHILPPMVLHDFRDQHRDKPIGIVPLGFANKL
jgi:hypothetical protein